MVTVTFIDLITFFGVASFFAWLTYGPLQRDLLGKYENSESRVFERARRNFYTVNDYFLVSFGFYSADIVGEYILQRPELYLIGPNPLYNNALLRFVIAICFGGGFVTLVAPVWYLRSVQTGNRVLSGGLLPSLSFMLYVSGVTVMGLLFSRTGFMATNSRSEWLALIWFGIEFAALMGAMIMMVTYEHEYKRDMYIAGVVNLLPVLVYFALAFLGWL